MKKQKGSILVTLLIFVVTGVVVVSAATMITVINTDVSSKLEFGEQAFTVAQAGAENGIIKLIRNRSYSGETLTINEQTATITVSGDNPYTITSTSLSGGFKRTIQVVGSFTQNVFIISRWKEID